MDLIVISTSVANLTGKGTEYLVDQDGNVLAKFYNGMLDYVEIVGDSEVTKGVA